MDAFYPAVEVLDQSSLKGKPVIVGAKPPGRGVVSSASYEARVFGVRSAMPINRAYQLCPQGIFLPPRMSRYAAISADIRKIFHDYTPLVEPLSLDEAFLDVSDSLATGKDALTLGREIKARILNELGLSASVGVAHNKFLAKLGSELDKPDGFYVMPLEQAEIEAVLATLPVRALWGVGPKAEAELHRLAVRTVGDLQKIDAPELTRRFGKWGGRLYELSRGLDQRVVETGGESKSISSEHTFSEDTTDTALLEDLLRLQVEEVTVQMRGEGLTARVVSLKVRYEDFSTISRQTSVKAGLRTYQDVLDVALRIFRDRVPRKGRKIRLIGVGVSKFIENREVQGDLFSAPGGETAEKVDRTLEQVREKLGRNALTRGSLLKPEREDEDSETA